MSRLGLKGHATRGKEVINLLEMLGANRLGYKDTFVGFYYYIECEAIHSSDEFPTYSTIFTLEQFEEKFPYKVGDKVKAWVNGYCGVFNIQDITWDSIAKEVKYRIHDYWHSVENLQPYKEESMGGKETFKPSEGTLVAIDLTTELRIADEVEVILGDYEFVLKDGKTYFVKKNKYPKIYDECLKILGYNIAHIIPMNHGHNGLLMMKLQRLLIFRDAWWKMAGDWKPDWTNCCATKYSISCVNNKIKLFKAHEYNYILVFPTEEMRDAFYDAFEELINEVKELL